MRLLQTFVEPERECSYLADRAAQLEIRVMVDVTPEELGAMLSRGWRRFGPVYFRPACATCNECVTLRLDTDTFAPSKSQRRARKNALGLVRTMGVPIVDDERLRLYHAWHAHREAARGWEPSGIDAERYGFEFAFPHPSVREVTFRDPTDGALVGVGIVDEVPDALSAVYFYWDPERAPASLGVAHVVTLVEAARVSGKRWVYLGYRVLGCPSLVYKAKYGPHELLLDRPGEDETPMWVTNP